MRISDWSSDVCSSDLTARRVRQRVGNILVWSYSMGYRDSEAPMRAISKGLPRQPRQDGHFAAMPYDRVAAFIVTLRAKESFSRLALELDRKSTRLNSSH